MQSVNIFPLSLSQYQVWIDQHAYPNSTHLNVGGMGFINGLLDLTLFEATLQQLVAENQALRLLPMKDGQQQLLECWQGPLLEFQDFSHLQNANKATIDYWQDLCLDPISLDGKQRPWRIGLLRVSQSRYAITFKFHHIVMDGLGVGLVLQKLSTIYCALKNRSRSITQSLDYLQFIDESIRYKVSSNKDRDAEYWHSILSNLPSPVLEKRYPNKENTELPLANHYRYSLTAKEYAELNQFSKTMGSTSFHLFIAAVAVYFCRTSAKNEIVIGVPVLNRGGKRYKSTLGMFTLVMPLLVKINRSDSVKSLVKAIGTSLRKAYRYSKYPISMLGNDSKTIRYSRDHIFDVLVSFEINSFTADFGDAPTSEPQQFFRNTARYPLLIKICEFHDNEPVDIMLESNSCYYNASETEQLANRLQYLLMTLVGSADSKLGILPILLENERAELVASDKRPVDSNVAPNAPFIMDFENQVEQRPNATAIRTLEGTMSYASLNIEANHLAHHLLSLGVGRQSIVAVVMPRQAETVVALLAIAKAGAAFVPLDPDTPNRRLELLLQESGAEILITLQAYTHLHTLDRLIAVIIDDLSAPQYRSAHAASNLDLKPQGNDLAYLLFTSGSTGTPKGVLMQHAPLASRLKWLATTFKITPDDISLQSIQLTFDPALIDLFLPLTQGASVALPPGSKLAPTELAFYAETFLATTTIFVPTTLRYFNQAAQNHPKLNLRIAISGGEVLPKALADDFCKQTGASLFNLYGPTEAAIFATAHQFDHQLSSDPLSIGRAVTGSIIYILDEYLQPLPKGVLGEIFIGGSALARGYLNDPSLTAERFLDNPFIAGERIYRSGDSGYWSETAEVVFVGRIDQQIKLRGQRIEPAEIEQALLECTLVCAAAVKKIKNEIHAWLVLEQELDAELKIELQRMLRLQLPEVMIPSHFTQLTEMPQQKSGKLDYQALLPSHTTAPPIPSNASPRTELEQQLLELWQQGLEKPQNSIYSDFFSEGGDSLSALNLLTSIEKHLGQRLSLSTLIQNPTIATMANAIMRREQHSLMVNLSRHRHGTTIYLAASGHGDAVRFMPLVKILANDFNVQMLQPPHLNSDRSYKTMQELAKHYAALIQSDQKHAPVLLAGFSIGGIAIIETARHLQTLNRPIAGVILIDTVYPRWMFRSVLVWSFLGWLVKVTRMQELAINGRTLGTLFEDAGLNGQVAALNKYRPRLLSLPVLLITSSGLNRWHRVLFRPWAQLFKELLHEKKLSGFHGTLFNSENVLRLADTFRHWAKQSR